MVAFAGASVTEAGMSDSGRNARCGCGSGRKVKRCCGVQRGPGPDEMAQAFLADQAAWAAGRLLGISRQEFDEELFPEMLLLPCRDVSLQVPLPRVLSLELEMLRRAISDDDDETVQRLTGRAAAQLASPRRRADLAKAVLALADQGRIDPRVGAVAIVDVASDDSPFFQSSLLEALAVSSGTARTPGGLVVAAA
jgi:hypothetical protein